MDARTNPPAGNHQPTRSRSGALGAVIMAALTLSAACGPGLVPASGPSRESGQSSLMGETFAGANKCNAASHARPFVIEWDATDMSSFEALAARDVVFVRYVGCDLEVLHGCSDGSIKGRFGSYK